MGRAPFYTEQEIQFIRDNYLKLPVKRMATIMGRSGFGVKNKMEKLNLIVPAEIIEARKHASRFHKGHQAFNKGKKQTDFMSAESIEKTKKTRFQKNHTPHNTLEPGTEVQRKDSSGNVYLMIKIPERKRLVFKHVWIWENEFGKVAKGMNIIFRNGNSFDCRIENLECITDAELMARNTIHRFPAELVTEIKKVSKLKQTIKKLSHG